MNEELFIERTAVKHLHHCTKRGAAPMGGCGLWCTGLEVVFHRAVRPSLARVVIVISNSLSQIF